MNLTSLSLTNFRNYVRLELVLSDGLTLIQGANAQGKTSLLEAVYYLATSKSPHAGVERELVNWLAREDANRFLRVQGRVRHTAPGAAAEQIDVILAPSNGSTANYGKRVRINGVVQRAIDLVGHLRVVLFLPEDIELVNGAPSVRRRYLDIALCQIEPDYCRSLSTYNQVIQQRNALLRQLRERGGNAQQLSFWDDQVVKLGAHLMQRRQWFISGLEMAARERQRALTDGRERLYLEYLPSVDPAQDPAQVANQLALAYDVITEGHTPYAAHSTREIAEAFRAQLEAVRGREIAAAMTLLGPHRDDMRFLVQGRDLRTYGSRGQQRTATLALKLAEVEVMTQTTREPPVLLLDDVMSELDEFRRATLLQALDGVTQALITTTDWDDFTPDFRQRAHRLHVTEGRVAATEGDGSEQERPGDDKITG